MIRITNLRTNQIENPLGYELARLRLSWITENEQSDSLFQSYASVEMADDQDFNNIIYESGKRKDIDSLSFTPNVTLEPRTRYYWKVTVWGDTGDFVTSDIAWFETGKMDEQWQAKWITPKLDKEIHPLMRKSFHFDKEIESARIYISGLGIYHLEMNGEKVGDEYLAPGFHAYNYWLQYQTFDVTSQLKQGENAIGVMLGNGWYKGRFGFDGEFYELFGDQFALIAELHVTLKDGTTSIIKTDDTWKCTKSPIAFSGIYDGEIYDATQEIKDWSSPGLNDHNWEEVMETEINTEKFTSRLSLPVKVMEERKPIEKVVTPAGETVLDMGQNMTGWLRFKVDLPKGRKIHLQFGEILQGGNFYQENLRTAKAEYQYTSDGTTKVIEPYFTFYGFRYVKLTGFEDDIDLGNFTGCVLYSDIEETGHIETSNPLVNQLFQNAMWGQKGNFLDVPTDCPQRDERMGWTGDAQVFASTASFNMYSPAFFNKYMFDLREEQKRIDGSVPFTVPSITPEGEHLASQHGSAAWGDAATIIPWTLYLQYGDKELLSEQFETMRDWVDYIKKQDDSSGGKRLWQVGFHFGDWLALDGADPNGFFGGTDTTYVASAYYYYSTTIVVKAANVLGKYDLAEKYSRLAEEVKQAITNEFFTPNGKSSINTQTAYILALHMDLVPEHYKERIAQDLRDKLAEDHMHLKTGFVGTPYFAPALSEMGSSEDAYTLVLNEDYPSWLYAVKLGATTIWERWNSVLPDGSISDTGMNSLNHYSYGSIVEWMYRYMCGINPVERAPGFREILFTPRPDGRLAYAKATLNSAAGRIETGWKLNGDGSLAFTFKIPFNTKAKVVLPNAVAESVEVKDKDGTRIKLDLIQSETNVDVEIGPGEYSFVYMPTKQYIKKFTLSSTVREIIGNNESRSSFYELFPEINEQKFILELVINKQLDELSEDPLLGSMFTKSKITTFLSYVSN
ncbi:MULTISPECIES: alpha-L-rhamnosidase [unclassified Oceanobacillus]|uniref:alpha-L-rhamnosidase n=1 Tax=unclassified Oceanobacillus TaxID=2630292 RepID=UPI001BECB9CB|nr:MULTISPECIES: alpha-L-rhamnosidase [unclassified Oceanobacillus]MBT2599361.1 family 78 glycoside hydrolase catalytic domain [Oceanobacillus sp. ISL-74]MBT2652279.1 family 78 glycoside hydrolase catalytic domain [Oceanobacillus sp. ISL-73]